MNDTKVIVFSDTKGGVGKTTSVINIAYAIPLIQEDAKVLVIDTDAQANSSQTVFLNESIYWDKNLSDLYKNMLKGYNPTLQDIIERIYIPTYMTNKKEVDADTGELYYVEKPYGFHILPTCILMQVLETQTLSSDDSPNMRTKLQADLILKDIITIIKENLDYDYILIDCPPNMGSFVINAMMAADYMMIPAGMGTYSIYGVDYTLMLADVLENTRAHKIKTLGVFSTALKKGKASQYTHEQFILKFPQIEKFLTDIPYTVQVDNTTIEGGVISLTNKRIREGYKKIATEMIWKINNFDVLEEERQKRINLVDSLEEIEDTLIDEEEDSKIELLNQQKEKIKNEIETLVDYRKEKMVI